MDHDPAVFKEMRASQLAHFWSPSVSARVDGELTTFDFEHELAGLVISTDSARELYKSLGEQLGAASGHAPAQELAAKGLGEVKTLVGRPRSRWRAKARPGKGYA